MRYLFPIFFLLISTTILYGTTFLDRIHGLKDEKGEMHFEVSGYKIVVYDVKGSVNDEGTLRLVEKAYRLDYILMTYSDSTFKVENKIIESLIDTPDLPLQISQKCILLQKDDETITVLYLETSLDRDFVLEEEIVQACINGQLAKYVSDERTTHYITLAGKKISLPSGAEWIAPNKMICMKSLIDKSEFSSVSKARQYLSDQIKVDKAENIHCIKENEIDVLFDEEPVVAQRIVFRDSTNSEILKYLIFYYLVCELRGQYVACILSHYGYSQDDLYLPVLLESVMNITSISKQMYSTFSDKKDESKLSGRLLPFENSLFYEFQLSSLMPLENLRSVYKVAPALGIYLGFPVKKQMGIDVGIQFAVPLYSNFGYDVGGVSEYGKALYQFGINLRWRYQMKLSKDIYCFNYLGAGVAWLYIDITSYPELIEGRHSELPYSATLASLDLFVGFNIRYKKSGLFVEYHYIPYGNKDKIFYEFGPNSINLGFSYGGFLK